MLLSFLLLVVTISLKIHCPGVQNVHFRLPSVAQKRCMLNLPIYTIVPQKLVKSEFRLIICQFFALLIISSQLVLRRNILEIFLDSKMSYLSMIITSTLTIWLVQM